MKKLSILILCILSFNFVKASNNVFEFSDDKQVYLIGEYLRVFKDNTHKVTIDEILNSKDNFPFNKSEINVPNFGTSNATFWIEFTVKNNTKVNDVLLAIEFPELNIVNFYYPNNLGGYEVSKSGQWKKVSERDFHHQYYIFDLDLEPDQVKTYYLEIQTNEDVLFPVKVGTVEALYDSFNTQDFIFGVYYGILLIMILYNLGVYFIVRDESYLYYIIYIFFVGLVQLCFLGHGIKYFWTDNMWLADNMVYLSGIGSGIFVLLFAYKFLEVKKQLPKLKYGVHILSGIYGIALFLVFLKQPIITFNLINATAFLVSIYLILISLVLIRKGRREAKYFLFAWSWFFIAVIIFVLRNFGLLPFNAYTYYVLQIGSSIGIFLLSLALADKIKMYRKEKEEAQKRILEEINEKKNIIKAHNIELEQKVKERTNALELANKELKQKNNEKEVMMKEIHHRVKNNLQIVNSLLRMQSHHFEDPMVIQVFEECQNRVVSMALLHERMYKTDNIKHIDVKDHLTLLVEDLIKTYKTDKNVELNIKVEKSIDLGISTLVPLGLIINEIVTNSLKYAFKDVKAPKISILLEHIEGNKYQLDIGDNGKGFIKSDNEVESFGNELVEIFTEQLNGKIKKLDRDGTYYVIVFEKV
jgi:two-component sensor histidine kinase